MWGKPHTYAPPKDCLRGCGDGADRPEPRSQHPARMRDSPRATTVEVRCGASPIPTRRRRIACAVAATVPTGRHRPRNIPRGCGTRPARPPRKARCGASPIPTYRQRIACAVAATVPTGRNRPRNIPRGCGTRPARPPRKARCGASPTPTCRQRIACAAAATVPSCRSRPHNIPRGGGTRPARPPWKSGVGQAPPPRAAEGLPARLRRRCRPDWTAFAISPVDAGLAPHDRHPRMTAIPRARRGAGSRRGWRQRKPRAVSRPGSSIKRGTRLTSRPLPAPSAAAAPAPLPA